MPHPSLFDPDVSTFLPSFHFQPINRDQRMENQDDNENDEYLLSAKPIFSPSPTASSSSLAPGARLAGRSKSRLRPPKASSSTLSTSTSRPPPKSHEPNPPKSSTDSENDQPHLENARKRTQELLAKLKRDRQERKEKERELELEVTLGAGKGDGGKGDAEKEGNKVGDREKDGDEWEDLKVDGKGEEMKSNRRKSLTTSTTKPFRPSSYASTIPTPTLNPHSTALTSTSTLKNPSSYGARSQPQSQLEPSSGMSRAELKMEGKGKEGKEGKQGKQGKEGIEGKEGKNHMSLLKQRIAEARMRREKGGAVEGEKMEGMRVLRAAGQAKSGQREVLPQGREKEMVGRSDDDAREKEVMDMIGQSHAQSTSSSPPLPTHLLPDPLVSSVPSQSSSAGARENGDQEHGDDEKNARGAAEAEARDRHKHTKTPETAPIHSTSIPTSTSITATINPSQPATNIPPNPSPALQEDIPPRTTVPTAGVQGFFQFWMQPSGEGAGKADETGLVGGKLAVVDVKQASGRGEEVLAGENKEVATSEAGHGATPEEEDADASSDGPLPVPATAITTAQLASQPFTEAIQSQPVGLDTINEESTTQLAASPIAVPANFSVPKAEKPMESRDRGEVRGTEEGKRDGGRSVTSLMPSSSRLGEDRLAEMIGAVQPGEAARPSRKTSSQPRPASQDLKKDITCPKTPAFARSKRVRAVRPGERPIPTRVRRISPEKRTSRVSNAPPIHSRLGLTDTSSNVNRTSSSTLRTSQTRSSFSSYQQPLVEGIIRKPSSVVSIPDFTKAHKAAEARTHQAVQKVSRAVTKPDVGKTPGRVSRVRMMERAEFDQANEDYQRRREEALERRRREKEDAEWEEEQKLREAIRFRAHPVPGFVNGRS